YFPLFVLFGVLFVLNLLAPYICKCKIDERKYNLLKSSSFIFVLSVLLIVLFSIFVKPLFSYKRFASIYSLLIVIQSLVVTCVVAFDYSNYKERVFKGIYLFVCFLCFLGSISLAVPVKTNYLDPMMNFIKSDVVQYNDEYEIYALNPGFEEYLENWPDVKNMKNIKWNTYNSDFGIFVDKFDKKEYTKNGKKAVVYFTFMGLDILNFKADGAYKTYYYNTCYKLPFGKIVFNP
ncbi:hypothetical protein IJ670_03480, partial [bacterium]|nr:hypothetical protein [bacterium]